jgi:hypothetical protein
MICKDILPLEQFRYGLCKQLAVTKRYAQWRNEGASMVADSCLIGRFIGPSLSRFFPTAF